MRRRSTVSLFLIAACTLTLHVAAEPPKDTASPSAVPCEEPACGAPSLEKTPVYSAQIARGGDFSVSVSVRQSCRCTRHLSFLTAFTAMGAKTSREQRFKLDAAPGSSTTNLVLTNKELVKAKIAPGRYTIGFALYDEHEQAAGAPLSGLPFTFGTSDETLTAKPAIPASIARDGDLAIPFVFSNDGDIPSPATALVVFTRPEDTQGIEIYKPKLVVPPGGTKHVVHVSAAERRKLGVGAGPWLVTVSAFDGGGGRLASFPGNLLMIGKVLSIPSSPSVTSPIEKPQDLSVTLTIQNDGDTADLVTALLIFTRPGLQKPIEYKVEGIHVAKGSSSHPIVLSSVDRYNLGIGVGHWKVAASALDRAGKRLELRRATDLVITDSASNAAPK